jgi:phenylalanine ammonia-lyase
MIEQVTLRGEGLTLEELIAVARNGASAKLTTDRKVWERFEKSCAYVNRVVEQVEPVYGVTTSFGGMANVVIPADETKALQNNLIRAHHSGVGEFLPVEVVRAAMLLRANSHLKGASGVRRVLVDRFVTFLNEGVTPHVRELGSIGASGDLIPLAYITGSLIGSDPSFTVDFKGETLDSLSALNRLGLERLDLLPKEGLVMINGTSVMTAMAAISVHDGLRLLALAMGAHALFIQGLRGTNQSFHPYIHQLKPHPGQLWAAEKMLRLLSGSKLCRSELDGHHHHRGSQPIQDRYSMRCLPQYLGPIVDGLNGIKKQIEVEANSASDNPLIDCDMGVSYHGGNFLGQYVGVAMDHFRYYLGLLAKHLDAQIALLVSPEFNNGLPASLVGNPQRKINLGLKALQICGNSIMPLIAHLGNSLADRFATHAEQFNQNINSLGFGSANLARESLRLCRQYLAISLIFGVQAVDLRTFLNEKHYDARSGLSPETAALYEAVKSITGRPPSRERPFIWDDGDQSLDEFIGLIARDIASQGKVIGSLHLDAEARGFVLAPSNGAAHDLLQKLSH